MCGVEQGLRSVRRMKANQGGRTCSCGQYLNRLALSSKISVYLSMRSSKPCPHPELARRPSCSGFLCSKTRKSFLQGKEYRKKKILGQQLSCAQVERGVLPVLASIVACHVHRKPTVQTGRNFCSSVEAPRLTSEPPAAKGAEEYSGNTEDVQALSRGSRQGDLRPTTFKTLANLVPRSAVPGTEVASETLK
jgi:hypothetical protein